MRTQGFLVLCSALVLGPALSIAQGVTASNPEATSPTKNISTSPSRKKSASPQPSLVTLRGELALVMSAAPFGSSTTIKEPSTKTKQGGIDVEARPMPLAIGHQGKDYRIYMTRNTKLDDQLQSGMFSSGATYRVVGTVRDNVIFATEITKE